MAKTNNLAYSRIFSLASSISIQIADLLVLLFVFILPIKFTVPAMLPNSGIFPFTLSEWVFEPWSTSIFPILSAAFLIIVIIWILIEGKNLRNLSLMIPFLWTILAVASLLGFIHASCLDFPILEISYLFGLCAFCLLIFLKVFTDELFNEKIVNTLVTCSVILAFYALYQYFFGFENTKEYIASLINGNTMSLPGNIMQRLNSNQVFSTFSISNNFAGYLILMLPLSIFSLFSYPFKGSNVLKNTIAAIIALSLILALVLTESRSAIISLIIAFILISIFVFKIKKYLLILFSFVSLSLIVSFFALFSKGFASIMVRFDYLNTALILLKNHLFTGSGWGSFFHSYPFLKKYMTGEAPNDPHNFLLSLGSQSGIVTLLLVLAIFLIPLFISFKNLRALSIKNRFKSIELPLTLGYTAWIIHSLTDTNFQIAGSVSIAIVFSALILKSSAKKANYNPKATFVLILFMFLSIVISTIGLGWNRAFGEYYLSKLNSICYIGLLNYDKDTSTQENNYKLFSYYLSNSIKYMPYSPFPFAAASQYEERLNNLTLAKTYMKNALDLSPERSSFYYEMSVILAKEGEKADALYCLKKASELFPYEYNGIYQRAKKQLEDEQ